MKVALLVLGVVIALGAVLAGAVWLSRSMHPSSTTTYTASGASTLDINDAVAACKVGVDAAQEAAKYGENAGILYINDHTTGATHKLAINAYAAARLDGNPPAACNQ